MTTQTAEFLNTPSDPTLAPSQDDRQQYPIVQWSHNPGGWLLPLDRAQEFDVMLPWPTRTVRLGTNDVECYHTSEIEIAILAIKKTWYIVDADEKIKYLDKYQDGARSKTHMLCIVKDEPDTLFMLSAKGMTSGDIHGRLGKLTAAMKKVGAAKPWYFFWLKIAAGTPERLKQGATVTPAVVEIPGKDEDVLIWLQDRFVGREFVEAVEALHHDAIVEFSKAYHVDEAAPEAPASGNGHTADGNGFDGLKSATSDRDIALVLAKGWAKTNDHEAAAKWALERRAFVSIDDAKETYRALWHDCKKAGKLNDWYTYWIDSVLAMIDTDGDDELPF